MTELAFHVYALIKFTIISEAYYWSYNIKILMYLLFIVEFLSRMVIYLY